MLFRRVVMKTQILYSLAVNATPASVRLNLTPLVGSMGETLAYAFSLEIKLQRPTTPV